MKRVEQRFKDYVALREKGYLMQDAAKTLGVTRQTVGRYEKRIKLKAEHYNRMIERTKLAYERLLDDENTAVDDLARLADTLATLISCRNKDV